MEGLIDQVARGFAGVELNEDQLPRMRVPELREELRRRNLRVTGCKPELLARLRASLLLERDRIVDNEEEELDEDDDDEEDEAEVVDALGLGGAGLRHQDGRVQNPAFNNHRNHYDEDGGAEDDESDRHTPVIRRRNATQRVLFTFKDVEGSLEKFNGDSHSNIRRWLDDFEEMAALCAWNEVQKIVYAKRLLEGSVKLFVNYERCARTWHELKEALIDEFEETVDNLKIHRELSKRKKKNEETLQEFAYKMLQIAAPASLDARTVIQYIIEGIPDDAVNKALLYGAKDIRQLKERFAQYEQMKQEMAKAKTHQIHNVAKKNAPVKTAKTESNNETKAGVLDGAKRRCFNCGSEDYVSSMCPDKAKGKKCFKCDEFGHVAAMCTAKPKDVYVVSRPLKEKYQKQITIKYRKMLALVDTGSDLTLMRKSEYERLGLPPLQGKQVCFEGLGSEMNETLGKCNTSMEVKHDKFTVKFHVVPDAILKRPVLLGTDFLDQVELRIRRGEVTLFKLEDDESMESPHIFKINVVDETKEVGLSHIKEQYLREETKKNIVSYKPEATRDVGIRAKIILKSEKLVASRPRKLAPSERREVNEIMKSPTTVKTVQSFLGLTGYFGKFVPEYSLIARPLTDLLKKDIKFNFGAKEIGAFERFKAALTCEPVLKIYRVGAETDLHTDVSRWGYGMILIQKDNDDGKLHPVHYASGKTTDAESRYCSYELEVLAIVKTLEEFRVYLLNIKFKIVTDCQVFTATVKKEKICLRMARWVLLLSNFDYVMEHRPGKNMAHVDAFTRNPLPEIFFIFDNDESLIARLRSAQNKDASRKQIIDVATRNEADGYLLRNHLLYKRLDGESRVVVPKSMEMQVIKRAHDRGYLSINRTEDLLKRDFWFKWMRLKPKKSPCQLLFGINMRLKEDLNLNELLEKEWATQFEEDREELRQVTKQRIQKTQEENRRGFNKNRKPAEAYNEGDWVAIQRSQFEPGLKLKRKFLGPYRVIKALRNYRYLVEKVGEHEGPQRTSTSADHMKRWAMASEEGNKTTVVEFDNDK